MADRDLPVPYRGSTLDRKGATVIESRPVQTNRAEPSRSRSTGQTGPPRPASGQPNPRAVPRGTSRRQPVFTQSVPRRRGLVGGMSTPHKVLFASWAVAVGLRGMQDVRLHRDWPCPGPILKISALYLMLGVMSEVAPSLAAWLGVGFLVAYVGRVGGQEVVKQGTFFGVPVQRR